MALKKILLRRWYKPPDAHVHHRIAIKWFKNSIEVMILPFKAFIDRE